MLQFSTIKIDNDGLSDRVIVVVASYMCTMLEKQDDNLIDSLIEREWVEWKCEWLKQYWSSGSSDWLAEWKSDSSGEVNEVRVIEWAKSLAIFRSFAMGEWFNWKQTNKNWPGRATIYFDYSTTIYKYLQHTEKKRKSTWYECFPSSFLVWESCIWMWLCEMNSWVRSWLTVMNLQDTCTTVSAFLFVLFFFYSFLLSYSYFCSKVLVSLAVGWVWPQKSLGLHTWGSLIPAQRESQQNQQIQS